MKKMTMLLALLLILTACGGKEEETVGGTETLGMSAGAQGSESETEPAETQGSEGKTEKETKTEVMTVDETEEKGDIEVGFEDLFGKATEETEPAKTIKISETVPEESPSIWKLIAFTIAGLAVILVSSDYAVDAATALAKIFNISDRVIGLTIVALGTSLPELVTSATAALRGNGDLAVGNVIGSCIFNILFVLGSSALIMPIPCASNFLSDAYVAVAATILLLIFGYTQRKIVRWEGLLLLACYVAYAYVALV